MPAAHYIGGAVLATVALILDRGAGDVYPTEFDHLTEEASQDESRRHRAPPGEDPEHEETDTAEPLMLVSVNE